MDLSLFSPEQLDHLRAVLRIPVSSNSNTSSPSFLSPTVNPTLPPVTGQIYPSASQTPQVFSPGPPPALAQAPPIGQTSLLAAPIVPSAPLPNLQIAPTAPSSNLQIAPIIQPYISQAVSGTVQTQSLVASSQPSRTGIFQPFLGAPNLSLSLAAGHANQARRASSSSQAHAQPSLPARGSRLATISQRGQGRGRARGPAQRPPSLPSRGFNREGCLITNTAVPSIQITVKVFPPIPESSPVEQIAYRFLRSSVNIYLQEHHLLTHHDLPLAFLVDDLLQLVADNMQNSPAAYRFSHTGPESNLTMHELLPLRLLAYKCRGQARGSSPNVKLIAEPYTPNTTVEDIFQKRTRFSPAEAFENSRFVINLVVASSAFTAMIGSKRHSCIGKRFYQQFPDDTPFSKTDNQSDSSGGEDSEAELTETEMAPRHRPFREESFWIPPVSIPKSIWDQPFVSSAAQNQVVYSSGRLSEDIFEAANSGNDMISKFIIQATSAAEMAMLIESRISHAVDINDFSDILSPEREFNIVDSHGSNISFGPGIEREAFYTIFERYRHDENSEWLLYHDNARAAIKTMYPLATSQFASPQRLKELKKFGAICAILLILGQCPAPIDPCIFQYAVHGKDLEAIHPAFLGEWHPQLRAKILAWKNLGPSGNISEFDGLIHETLGFGAACLDSRTDEIHSSLAAGLLYHSIFGPEPHHHPEWKAFYAGFALHCRNGFSFLQVPKGFEGGSEAFFSLMWISQIQGFQSLSPFLRINRPGITIQAELNAALSNAGVSSVKDHIQKFFEGTGIPCPSYFASSNICLSPVIDMSQANTPSFRSRMFAWAATGSPFADPDSDTILVETVGADDSMYAANTAANRALMSQGVISFRTCMRVVRIPGPYIVALAKQAYPLAEGPANFAEAFDFWFFCQILTAIGSHTII